MEYAQNSAPQERKPMEYAQNSAPQERKPMEYAQNSAPQEFGNMSRNRKHAYSFPVEFVFSECWKF